MSQVFHLMNPSLAWTPWVKTDIRFNPQGGGAGWVYYKGRQEEDRYGRYYGYRDYNYRGYDYRGYDNRGYNDRRIYDDRYYRGNDRCHNSFRR